MTKLQYYDKMITESKNDEFIKTVKKAKKIYISTIMLPTQETKVFTLRDLDRAIEAQENFSLNLG